MLEAAVQYVEGAGGGATETSILPVCPAHSVLGVDDAVNAGTGA